MSPSPKFTCVVQLDSTHPALLLRCLLCIIAFIVEDDYDSEFRFSNSPLDALQTLDRSGRAFYIGTSSKVLFPSLREGFIVTPSSVRDMTIKAKQISDSHCEFVAKRTLASFIEEGHLAKNVRRMNQIQAARREVLLTGLEKLLSTWLRAAAICSRASCQRASAVLEHRGTTEAIRTSVLARRKDLHAATQ